jgi:hypothetical protein
MDERVRTHRGAGAGGHEKHVYVTKSATSGTTFLTQQVNNRQRVR